MSHALRHFSFHFALVAVAAFGLASCNNTSVDERTRDRGTVTTAQIGYDGGNACGHNLCAEGQPLSPSCDPCVAQICSGDPYCCGSWWDRECLAEVQSVCGQSCYASDGGVSPSDAGWWFPDAGGWTPDSGGWSADAGPGWTPDAGYWKPDAGYIQDGGGICNQASCAGCCDSAGNCESGTSSSACGFGGVFCTTCPNAEYCGDAGLCLLSGCNDQNCSDGCCLNDQCIRGQPRSDECGLYGNACQTCDAPYSCQANGTCAQGAPDGGGSCYDGTCAGCCTPNVSGALTCVQGTSDLECGAAGDMCTVCNVYANQFCVNQQCQ